MLKKGIGLRPIGFIVILFLISCSSSIPKIEYTPTNDYHLDQYIWNHKKQEYEGECTECGMCCVKEVNEEIVPCKYLDLKGK